MTARIDRRFLDRRRHVQEDGARRRLRWGIALVVAAALAAVSILVIRSPLLAVREVNVSGVANADVAAVLAEYNVTEGVPTIGIRASAVEDAIEADPWVARASVRVTWPGTIEVSVLEHVPAAWMEFAGGWMLVSASGVLLERGDPPEGAPRVKIDAAGGVTGARVGGALPRAALEFLGALPAGISTGAVVTGDTDGLRAVVMGREVVLGTGTDMRAKATALSALLDAGIPEGATVTLIAPAFPSVVSPPSVDPQPEVEGDEPTSTAGSD